MSGVLEKRGPSVLTGFKARWFTLVDGTVSYFANEGDEVPKGSFDLIASSEVFTVGPFGFTVSSSTGRVFKCRAADEATRDAWVQALIDHIQLL